MSAHLKKGITVWVLGFLTFLAALNAFNAQLLWALRGSDFEFQPYLVGRFTGGMDVTSYLWISLASTFVLLGCTALAAFRKPPLDPDLMEILATMDNHIAANRKTLEESLAANRKSIETLESNLREKMEAQRILNEKSFETLSTSLQNTRKETLDSIGKQAEELQKISRELSSTLTTSLSGFREQMLGALAKEREIIRKVGRASKRNAKTIQKGMADLAEVRAKLETLENTLVLPKPKLTSHSNTRDIKGIGPRLAGELEVIGITNVGEFLSADPALMEEKTRLTKETAERLQGTVQLLMIPGVDKTDVELLEKAGVTNRKELAEQDPFKLHRKLSEIAKTYIEERKISEEDKPTVEEVLSWIKLAK
jgi:nucleotidyltransferase/DNA polymerase involved in DNA repair